jgi:APA family basic amino acid/polyamine antiporter
LAEATVRHAAPLQELARSWTRSGWPGLIGLGAMTAMLGVLLNLILGLSRVVLAMGRRGDLPTATARLNAAGTTPPVAVVLVGLIITALAALGSLKLAWSFSAFTVLIYYAITNLAALALPREQRLYPPWIAAAGLLSCIFLAAWIELRIAAAGLLVLAAGLLLRTAWHSRGNASC